MRTFVSCYEIEAARRECIRKGLEPRTEEWSVTFGAAYESILARNKLDAERPVGPVRADVSAVDCWYDDEAIHSSAWLPKVLDRSILSPTYKDSSVFINWLTERANHKQQLRCGVGCIACRDDRQIHFETSIYPGHFDDPLSGMLTAARTMLEEAAGRHPWTDFLVRRKPRTVPQPGLTRRNTVDA